MVVDSTLGRVRQVVSVGLMRSFESSSSSLELEMESLLERRLLRMRCVMVEMIPILAGLGWN